MYSAFMQYNEVLVTGGTGLLGRYVCPSLIGHGLLPRLLVPPGSGGKIAPDVRERCRVTPGGADAPRERGDGRTGDLGDRAPRGGMEGAASTGGHLRGSERARNVQPPPLRVGLGDPSADLRRRHGGAPRRPGSVPRRKGKAEELVRGSNRAWTVFRVAPWYDLATESRGFYQEYLEELAAAIANRYDGRIQVGRVYEDSSTDRFRWKELSRGS